jgi:hypothetical protein
MGYLYHFLVVAIAMLPAQQARGVVSAVAISPSPVDAGVAVRATVTGTNPCGAVHIDWGDGSDDSRTFPITNPPNVQTHVYRTSGTYKVRARGMGNCDGDVTTTISVVQKAPAPQITAVAIDRARTAAGKPVAITVHGSGECSYTIDFGDGNSDERSRALPDTLRHNYPAPGRYTVTATAAAPCAGRAQRVLEVRDPLSAPVEDGRIRRIALGTPVVRAGEWAAITVEGTGYCHVLIEFGDGESYAEAAPLPLRVGHVYREPGRYKVYAGGNEPCRGAAVASVRVRRR